MAVNMFFAAAPSELMWPGVPVMACATIRASVSNSAVARSPASRTIGLKAMRCSAFACSLTMLIRLPHMISSSMPSIPLAPLASARRDEAAVRMHRDRPARQHVDGGLALLDEHRSRNPLVAGERVAIVDVHRHVPAPEMHLSAGSGPARLAVQGHADGAIRRTAMSRGTPADDLHVDVVEAHAIERLVSPVEARPQIRAVPLLHGIALERHGHFALLPEITHIGGKVVEDFPLREPRLEQRAPSFRAHFPRQPAHFLPVDGAEPAQRAARQVEPN